ncbi:MAG TPA: CHAT domain-containing protein [Xanthobacteraceae bacterium]|jgi:CHAT domain-containing protein|nr:CHAT domain-containing protein [Xanthobacteraceae bacterium]
MKQIFQNVFQHVAASCTAAFVCVALVTSALAANHEEIIERCRSQFHEQIMACAMAKGLRGNPEAVRAQCGVPLVRPCVVREEIKQSAGTPAPAAPKEDAISAQSPTEIQRTFVAPPRTIADIAAILDSEKPDPAKIAKRKADAEASPPGGGSTTTQAEFYLARGNARALLARNKDALADGLQALSIAGHSVEPRLQVRIRQFISIEYRALGDPKNSIAMSQTIVREADEPGRRGSLINALAMITGTLVSMGDVSQAGTYAARIEQRLQEARGSVNPRWRSAYVMYGHSWEGDGARVQGIVYEARGQYPEAEAAYQRAYAFKRAAIKDIPKMDFPPPPEQMILAADQTLLAVARVKARQGRRTEAEADTRVALLDELKTEGKYAPATPEFINSLAAILVEQGRYEEAEKLSRGAIDVLRTLGIADEAPESVHVLSELGNILVAQRKGKQAADVYAQIDQAIAQWSPAQREAFALNGSRIAALYATGQTEAGVTAAEALVKRQTERTGANSFDTANAQGTLAVGYARAERFADAVRVFQTALPVLVAGAHETDDDDPTLVAARNARLQRTVETYISVLARKPELSKDVASETFGLADAIRGHAVQQALADSSARMVAKDPALAELVRTDQDHAKQITATLGALNNLLAQPSDQRDDATVRAMNADLAKLRTERKAARQEINKRFPAYADMIDPKPPTVDAIKAALRPGEALLSFYFGQDRSFVWAVPKDGPVAFSAVPLTAIELEADVRRLREALEPQVSMVPDIPAFDVGLAHKLYTALLKPVESGWQSSKSLIVVTNGALGELPLALLPTAPAQVDAQAEPFFSGYRNVPWLARTHAVTVVPSASALVTLRQLPAGAAGRDKLIGFGDPFFNAQEAAEAEAEPAEPESDAPQVVAANTADLATVMRGFPLKLRAAPHTEDVDKAQLAMLPRLPDTRLELTAIAKTLGVDPAKTLFLGKDANEENVETKDLSHFRIVAFATHGLVPGDVDGLIQPALALSAPDVSNTKGDGLLTMEKILALKLDADWVVLSACNTAAGAGAGAEAASGLGSAFFYAGTRALLVTNWSVHSASARELITGVFKRQSADASLSRAEALRQSMVAMIDSGGYKDEAGRVLFDYAHPLFWAPYSLIGDGGASQ